MGVTSWTNSKSAVEEPVIWVYTLSKMGHSSMPNGRSIVGLGMELRKSSAILDEDAKEASEEEVSVVNVVGSCGGMRVGMARLAEISLGGLRGLGQAQLESKERLG